MAEGHIYKDEEIYIKAEFKKIYDDKNMLSDTTSV